MEECSVLIESILPAEDKTSRWFNLPIDYELFRDLLGVEADSGDYQIMDMKLPFAGDIVRTTSVRRLNRLYFAYMELPPEVQQAYNDLISYCGGVEDLLQKSEEFRFYPECHSIMDVARYRLEHTVTNVLVWNVEQSGTDDFTVAYEVDQQVKEGEQTQAVTENYTVTVHVDKDGAMVITQNPTLAPAVQKSEYEPKAQEADASVSSDTVKDATAFLETFFKLYPTATEKELAYYVKDGVLAPVSGDYVFSELVNPVFTKDGDNLKVNISVKYLDNKSKMTQISQYEFVLHKDDNWKII